MVRWTFDEARPIIPLDGSVANWISELYWRPSNLFDGLHCRELMEVKRDRSQLYVFKANRISLREGEKRERL